jgi:GR25 family glycosyltransferase involved in LPS biosynthesis
MNEIEIYCLSFRPERRQRMSDLFEKIGVSSIAHISHGVAHDDVRLARSNHHRAWSCMYGHLDMISDFYHNTSKPYGIFCEDDIAIHSRLADLLPSLVDDFKKAQLDILLLGYLSTFKPTLDILGPGFERIDMDYASSGFGFHCYQHPTIEIWGTQMYMISREYAKWLTGAFANGYAEYSVDNLHVTPFSADWIITKNGRRAMITPSVAVEIYDYEKPYDHGAQDNFHRLSYEFHFDANIHSK